METPMEADVPKQNKMAENPAVAKFPDTPAIVVTEAPDQILPPSKPADAVNTSPISSSFIAQAKAEYAEVHRRIIKKIRPQHLEPLTKILSEREKITPESTAGLVESLKIFLGKRLSSEDVLNQPGVVNNLLTLEMLKEKYRQYEGVDWNVQNKTPEQHTLPLQIQFKEKQLNALRRQMSFQNMELDKILSETEARRLRIQEVTQERVFLKQNMVRHTERLKQMDAEMRHMQIELLDLMDKP